MPRRRTGWQTAQLNEEPRVAHDQVIFQVTVEIVIAQPLAQGGMAFKTEQQGICRGADVIEVAIAQRQLLDQMIRAGRADENIELQGRRMIGRSSGSAGNVDLALWPAKLLAKRGQAIAQSANAWHGVWAQGAMPAATGRVVVMRDGKEEAHASDPSFGIPKYSNGRRGPFETIPA